MTDTSFCSICGVEDSWRHSLIDCSVARCVWALADEEVTKHMCMNENPSAKLWLSELWATLSRDDFTRFAVTLWAVWYERWRIIHDEIFKVPFQHILLWKTTSETC
jgi:hypothetical protein